MPTTPMLTTPDGLTPSQERQFEELKARMRLLDRRLTHVVELCDELMADDATVYGCSILHIREAASGEEL